MNRHDLERLSKGELIEMVLRLQRPDKTSRTSSKPPSTDRKERRENSKPGGAKPGHKGHSRSLSENPDAFEDHTPTPCPCCVRYEASLAARRHELVDPAKRFVARELETRWNGALEKVVEIERRIEELRATAAARPMIDRVALMQLAADLPAAWNAPTVDTRTKQRLIHILIQEIICDVDGTAKAVVLLIHWTGGRHSEVRVPRAKTDCWSTISAPSGIEAIRKLATRWSDREIAVSLNRMRCKASDGETWTTVRVLDARERLGLPEGRHADDGMISLAKAAEQLNICIGSAKRLVERGILPATQLMPGATWLVPATALETPEVRLGTQGVIARRPKNYENYQYDKAIRLPEL